jgi:hypothetical protein
MIVKKVPILYNNITTNILIEIQQDRPPNPFWIVSEDAVRDSLRSLEASIPTYSGVKSWYVWGDHVLLKSTPYDGIPMNPPHSSMFSCSTPL